MFGGGGAARASRLPERIRVAEARLLSPTAHWVQTANQGMANLLPRSPRIKLRWSRFGLAARPSVLIVRRLKRTGLHPLDPRGTGWRERQRIAALELVAEHRETILAAAERYRVAPEAIAGAILWDPLENPYRRPF